MAEQRQWLGKLVIAVIAATAGAGAAAYFTAANPQRIEYSLRSTPIGADTSLKTLLPQAQITIGDRSVSSLILHNLVVKAVDGDFVESASGAVDFDEPVELLGPIRSVAPSSAHQVTCEPRQTDTAASSVNPGASAMMDGIVCLFEPLDGTGSYEIGFATSRLPPIRFSLPAARVQLLKTDQSPSNEPSISALVSIAIAAVLLPAFFAFALITAVESFFKRRIKGLLILDELKVSDSIEPNGIVLSLALQKRSQEDIQFMIAGYSLSFEDATSAAATTLDKFLVRSPYHTTDLYNIRFESPPAPGTVEATVELDIRYGRPDSLKYTLPVKGHLAVVFDSAGKFRRAKWQEVA